MESINSSSSSASTLPVDETSFSAALNSSSTVPNTSTTIVNMPTIIPTGSPSSATIGTVTVSSVSSTTSEIIYFCAELLDQLSRFELELLTNPYVKEKYPILLVAVAQARRTAIAGVQGTLFSTSNDTSVATSPVSVTTTPVNASTNDNTQSKDNVLPLLPSSLLNLSRTPTPAERALVQTIQAFGMVVQANDITGYLTLLALRYMVDVVNATARAPVSMEAAAAALTTAVHAASQARFELTDAATDELVYISIVDTLTACMVHKASTLLPGSLVADTAHALLRTAIDATHARTVRQRSIIAIGDIAASIARRAVTDSLLPSTHTNSSTDTIIGSSSNITAHQEATLELLHTLCDIIGVPDPTDMNEINTTTTNNTNNNPANGGGNINPVSFVPDDSSVSASSMSSSSSSHISSSISIPAFISNRERLLPEGCLLHIGTPIQVTDDISSHLRYGSGPEGSGNSIKVIWNRFPHLSMIHSSSNAANHDTPILHDDGHGPSTVSSRDRSGTIDPNNEILTTTQSNTRLTIVSDGAVNLSLSLLARILQELLAPLPSVLFRAGKGTETSVGKGSSIPAAFTRTPGIFQETFIHLLRTRLCLALIWLGDGAGPDSSIVPTPIDPENKPSSGLFSSFFGGSSSGGTAPTVPTANDGKNNPNNAAVTMKLPQLPLFFQVLRLISLLYGSDTLRTKLSVQLEHIILRVIIRAATAPARLAMACAVYVGLPAMRIINTHLADAQRQRDIATAAAVSAATLTHPSDKGSGTGYGFDLNLDSMMASMGNNNTYASFSVAQINAITKSIMSTLSSSELVFVLDQETIKTLVGLLSPRSPLLVCASAALETLYGITAHPTFIPDTMLAYDGTEARSDVLRCVVQTCAGLALGHVHVHTLHGTIPVSASESGTGHSNGTPGTAGGGDSKTGSNTPLILPIPEAMRQRAAGCLFVILGSFKGKVSREAIASMATSTYTSNKVMDPRSRAGSSFSQTSHHSSEAMKDTTNGETVPSVNDTHNNGTSVWSTVHIALDLLRTNLHRKRLLQSCARAFNAKPKRGVEAMRATGLLPSGSSVSNNTVHAAVATILRTYGAAAGFDPVAVGEYLGTGDTADDDTKRRAHAGVYSDDVSGRPLVSSLRTYLRAFRLPGEAQQIDRVLQAFAGLAHMSCRESAFLASIDATYLLAFSIIMLNTDLHNPNIRPDRRMTEDAFVRNNVYYSDEICHGRRTPEPVLRRIYTEIRNHPIAPPPITHSLIPLMAPALDAPVTATGNMAAAMAFAGSGDMLAWADWELACEHQRIQEQQAYGQTEGSFTSTTIIDSNTYRSNDLVQAAWIAAIPEVWHACVRHALTSFANTFRDPSVNLLNSVSSSTFRGYNGPSLPSSFYLAARSYNGNKDMDSMASAVEDAIKSNARSHLRTLATASSLAAEYGMSSGVDIIIAALCRIATESLRSPYQIIDTGSSNDYPGANTSSYGGGKGTVNASTVNNLASRGSQNRLPSSSPVPTPTPAPSLPKRISDEFASDLRGQMAFAAAIAIALPSAQGNALRSTGWHWLLECLLRLSRINLLSIPTVSVILQKTVGNNSTDSKIVTGSGSHAPNSADTESVEHLLQAYAVASAQYRHIQRKRRAEAVRYLAEKYNETNTVTDPNTVSNHGGINEDTSVKSTENNRNTATEGTAANAFVNGTTDSSGSVPTDSTGNGSNGTGLRSMLFGWLFGETEVTNSTNNNSSGNASNSTNNDTFGNNANLEDISDSREWAELVAEESEDEEDEDHTALDNDNDENVSTPRRSLFSFGSSPVTTKPKISNRRLAFKASIDALIYASRSLVEQLRLLQPHALIRVLNVLLRLSGGTHNVFHSIPDMNVSRSTTGTSTSTALVSPSLVSFSPRERQRLSSLVDDGSAFISGMETARYKCALLPTPPESTATTLVARMSLDLHSTICAYSVPSFQYWLDGIQTYLVKEINEISIPTRRMRNLLQQYLGLIYSLFVSKWTAPTDPKYASIMDDQLAHHTLLTLHKLVYSLPPLAGAIRLAVSAFLSRCCTHSVFGIQFLDIFMNVEDGDVMMDILRICCLPGWSDDDGELDTKIDGNDTTDEKTENGTGSGSNGGNGERTSSIPSVRSVSNETLAIMDTATNEGGDDLHVLELTLATSSRLVVDILRHFVAQLYPSTSTNTSSSSEDTTVNTPTPLISTLSLNQITSFIPKFIHLLDKLASQPNRTVTITLDEISCSAIGVLASLCANLYDLYHNKRSIDQIIVHTKDKDSLLDYSLTILSNLSFRCIDSRASVRLHSLDVLQALVLHLNDKQLIISSTLSNKQLLQLFMEVLYPTVIAIIATGTRTVYTKPLLVGETLPLSSENSETTPVSPIQQCFYIMEQVFNDLKINISGSQNLQRLLEIVDIVVTSNLTIHTVAPVPQLSPSSTTIGTNLVPTNSVQIPSSSSFTAGSPLFSPGPVTGTASTDISPTPIMNNRVRSVFSSPVDSKDVVPSTLDYTGTVPSPPNNNGNPSDRSIMNDTVGNSIPVSMITTVLCEHTIYAAVNMLCKVYLQLLPSLLRKKNTSSSSSENEETSSAITVWSSIIQIVDILLGVAIGIQGTPTSPLAESLREVIRNFWYVSCTDTENHNTAAGIVLRSVLEKTRVIQHVVGNN